MHVSISKVRVPHFSLVVQQEEFSFTKLISPPSLAFLEMIRYTQYQSDMPFEEICRNLFRGEKKMEKVSHDYYWCLGIGYSEKSKRVNLFWNWSQLDTWINASFKNETYTQDMKSVYKFPYRNSVFLFS